MNKSIEAYNRDEYSKLEKLREEMSDEKAYIDVKIEEGLITEKERLRKEATKEVSEAKEYYARTFREKCWNYDFQRYLGLSFSFGAILLKGFMTADFRTDFLALFLLLGKAFDRNFALALMGMCGIFALGFLFVKFYIKHFKDDSTLLFQLIVLTIVCFLCELLHLIPYMNVIVLYIVVNLIYVAKRWCEEKRYYQ